MIDSLCHINNESNYVCESATFSISFIEITTIIFIEN